MTRFLKSILLLMAIVSMNCAMAATKQFCYGFCSVHDDVSTFSLGLNTNYYPYLNLPADVATRYAGCRVMGVKFYVGATSDTTTDVYISTSYDKEGDISKASGAIKQNSWNEIYFAEPYTVKAGEELYFGYKVGATMMQQPVGYVPFTTANDDAEFLSYVYSGTKYSYTDLGSKQHVGHLALLAIMEGEEVIENDLTVGNIVMNEIMRLGSEQKVTFEVHNLGANDVTSFDYTCKVAGNAQVTKHVEAVIKPDAKYLVEETITAPAQVGDFEVEVIVSNPNGVADTNPDNDSATGTAKAAKLAERQVLMEQFTTLNCSSCPDFYRTLHEVMPEYEGRVVWTAHHSGYTYDELTTEADKAYEWLYKRRFAPAFSVDRYDFTGEMPELGRASNDSPVISRFDAAGMRKVFDFMLNRFITTVDIDIESDYNESTRELTVKLTAYSGGGDVDGTFLNLWLNENEVATVQQQNGGTAGMLHSHVFRQNLSKVWGDQCEWTDGVCERTYTYTVPETFNASKLELVGFVANYNANDRNDCRVINVRSSRIGAASGVETVDANAADAISVVGNAIVAGGAIQVYSADGSLKAQGTDRVVVPAGFYVVKASQAVKKVIVK